MRKTVILAIVLTVILPSLLANCRKREPTPEKSVERIFGERIRAIGEYAAFDKAYIPALMFTNQGKVEQSQKAMARLKEAWKTYADKYYPKLRVHSEFRQSLDKIQNAIRTADHIVNSGGNLADAHEALEGIRYIFMSFRESGIFGQSGMTTPKIGYIGDLSEGKSEDHWLSLPFYYIDYLNRFHKPMEIIVLTAKDKTSETLTESDIENIVEQLDEASGILTKMENAEFDQSIYDFSDEKTLTMQNYMSQEGESLSILRKALEDKNKEEIIRASIGIKPVFVKLYTMFGDFEGLE